MNGFQKTQLGIVRFVEKLIDKQIVRPGEFFRQFACCECWGCKNKETYLINMGVTEKVRMWLEQHREHNTIVYIITETNINIRPQTIGKTHRNKDVVYRPAIGVIPDKILSKINKLEQLSWNNPARMEAASAAAKAAALYKKYTQFHDTEFMDEDDIPLAEEAPDIPFAEEAPDIPLSEEAPSRQPHVKSCTTPFDSGGIDRALTDAEVEDARRTL